MAKSTSTSLRFAAILTLVGGFLDTYTYITRNGVFANAQTANVIFLCLHLVRGAAGQALAHLWPVLAFIVGICVAQMLQSIRAQAMMRYPVRFALLIEIAVLAVIGFVPQSVPDPVVTISVSFVAALQLGLFRTVADLAYMTIATTGNLMRFTESTYALVVRRDPVKREAVRIYAVVISSFVAGAVLGVVCSETIGTAAAWVAAALVATALGFFYVDDLRLREPGPAPVREE